MIDNSFSIILIRNTILMSETKKNKISRRLNFAETFTAHPEFNTFIFRHILIYSTKIGQVTTTIQVAVAAAVLVEIPL